MLTSGPVVRGESGGMFRGEPSTSEVTGGNFAQPRIYVNTSFPHLWSKDTEPEIRRLPGSARVQSLQIRRGELADCGCRETGLDGETVSGLNHLHHKPGFG